MFYYSYCMMPTQIKYFKTVGFKNWCSFLLANSIRQRVKSLRTRYEDIGDAEEKLGLDVDHYVGIGGVKEHESIETHPNIKITAGHWKTLAILTQSQKVELIKKLFPTLDLDNKIRCCQDIFFTESDDIKEIIMSLMTLIMKKDAGFSDNGSYVNQIMEFVDELYLLLAVRNGITTNPGKFGSISIKAMIRLQSEHKSNLVYKFSQMLTSQKFGDVTEPVVKLDMMPFGLLDYTIQFFTCPNVKQVKSIAFYVILIGYIAAQFHNYT